MTAHELARLLLRGPDIEVRAAAPAHDYLSHVYALPIKNAEQGRCHSGNDGTPYVVEDEWDVEDETFRDVIILR